MSGSRGAAARRRRRCRPARRPSRPPPRASSSRGRMPAENTTRSVGERRSPSAKRRPRDPAAVAGDDRLVVASPVCTRDAQRLDAPRAGRRRRRRRPAPASAAGRTRRRGSRGRGCAARWPPRGPSRPPPITAPALARRRPHAAMAVQVLDACGRRSSRGRRARDRRHERVRAGGQHQVVVERASSPTADVTWRALRSMDGDPVADVERPGSRGVEEAGGDQGQVLGGPARRRRSCRPTRS